MKYRFGQEKKKDEKRGEFSPKTQVNQAKWKKTTHIVQKSIQSNLNVTRFEGKMDLLNGKQMIKVIA